MVLISIFLILYIRYLGRYLDRYVGTHLFILLYDRPPTGHLNN